MAGHNAPGSPEIADIAVQLESDLSTARRDKLEYALVGFIEIFTQLILEGEYERIIVADNQGLVWFCIEEEPSDAYLTSSAVIL
ncbi:MAG: hypothetical protein RL240_275 [Planctomycetota bacterium]